MYGLVVYVVAVYLIIGAVLSVPLMLLALKRLDPAAKNATLGFRILMIPSLAIMWPAVFLKLIKP